MEIWIRSQDKCKLIKPNNIMIVSNAYIFSIVAETTDSAPYVGNYETKERALEILDEIQDLLESAKKHIDGEYTYYMPNDGSSKIYQMPKE